MSPHFYEKIYAHVKKAYKKWTGGNETTGKQSGRKGERMEKKSR